ncbi:probable E3 ubiquitin-protein ligase HERC1 isoform X1 [Lingula anatina]|uniref:Probable E3 ubiquitin-protein ligase HERC1 isoform X1 n=1 Tax=Lingula anatina TaxID=7574 RepID=A0A1S3K005_LINAN|nr:probable E3 ubiquitin-protein ligase HERC1 isoform X1 [Lingula anatina]|eukprot:XP_013415684.1 probable E3 ubiquitin-protein ligase HERC1 isoform X1 [Lingula anatina]
MRPKLIEDLYPRARIVDIACGDTHCLALGQDNEVYAWGNNAMGQCGQGHTQSPITRPKKVTGLEGTSIHQISAGTSHSVAWTALPTDRQVVAWHRPFCMDLQEGTFSMLRLFLERYCEGLDSEEPLPPYPTKSAHENFTLLCLKLLSTHLSLALAGGMSTSVLGKEARPLRMLLFRLMDSATPETVQQAVSETLSVGAPLLLPPLRERMELLHSLLPQGPERWNSLTKGQRMQLSIILTSLQDNCHVASLLGFGYAVDTSGQPDQILVDSDMHLAELLMKTILRNLSFYTMEVLNDLVVAGEKEEKPSEDLGPPACLQQLLGSMQKHVLAYCYVNSTDESLTSPALGLLHKHLSLMLPLTGEIFQKAWSILIDHGQSEELLNKIKDLLYSSQAGALLFQMIHSLQLLPVKTIIPILHDLLALLPTIDKLNRLLPAATVVEDQELGWPLHSTPESADASIVPLTPPVQSWVWLVDLERACALLVGRCIGGMLMGAPMSSEEKETAGWLQAHLLSNGLEMSAEELDKVLDCVVTSAISGCGDSEDSSSDVQIPLSGKIPVLLQIAQGQNTGPAADICQQMLEYARSREWDCTEEEDDPLLTTVSRYTLACFLKHTDLLNQTVSSSNTVPNKQMLEIYKAVFKVRQKLMAIKSSQPEPGEAQSQPVVDEGEREEETRGTPRESMENREEEERSREEEREEPDSNEIAGERRRREMRERLRELAGEIMGAEDRRERMREREPERLREREREPEGREDIEEPDTQTVRDDWKRKSKQKVKGNVLDAASSYEAVCKAVIRRCALLLCGIKTALTEEDLFPSVPEHEESGNLGSPLAIARSGSHPQLSQMWQHNRMTTLSDTNTEQSGVQQMGSLQAVKETLKRLRWRRDRLTSHHHPESDSHTILKTVLKELTQFVLDEGLPESVKMISGNVEEELGASTRPQVIARAMEHQQVRAECRMEALNQMLEMLSPDKDVRQESGGGNTDSFSASHPVMTVTSLLTSVHLQILAGCFDLGVMNSDHINDCHIYHYQDGVRAAPAQSQQEIQFAVHKIYELLVEALDRQEKIGGVNKGAQQRLTLVTIFALSVKYQPIDISLAVSTGLPQMLVKFCNSLLSFVRPLQPILYSGQSQLDIVLEVASIRLLQILAITGGTYAYKLSSSVIQALVDILHMQLQKLLDCACGKFLAEKSPVGGATGQDGETQTTEAEQERIEEKKGIDGMVEFNIKVSQSALGDFLVFLRRVALSKSAQVHFASKQWINVLLSIAGQTEEGVPVVSNLRCRLLALHLLETVLPAFNTDTEMEQMKDVVNQLFHSLTQNMWLTPSVVAKQHTIQKEKEMDQQLELFSSEDSVAKLKSGAVEEVMASQEALFDPDKSLNCSVENGHTLVHGAGGRGYGLGTTGVTSGCYQWKFLIVKENKGNEGTCVGISKWPVQDYSHRTTSDMWLYRAYSGNIYHNGEQTLALPSFTQGDYITCILDMDARTLAFGKNGEDPKIAFEDIDGCELFPCVMFYSSNPGEKVKITDMQVRGAPRDLLPGDPMCAPAMAVIIESTVHLLRVLHLLEGWGSTINLCLLDRLKIIRQLIKMLEKENEKDGSPAPDVPLRQEDGAAADDNLEQEMAVEALCKEVWPALAVIGGTDRGLRVGGRCIHKSTSRKGTLLGVVKDGSDYVKIQWDDSDASTSDAPVSQLEAGESTTFDMSKLSGLTPSLVQDIMALSAITEDRIALELKKAKGESEDGKKKNQEDSGLHKSLEKKLDADIAQVLADESPEDHNADKRQATQDRSSPDQNLESSGETKELTRHIRGQLDQICSQVESNVETIQTLATQMVSGVMNENEAEQSLAPDDTVAQQNPNQQTRQGQS